MDRAPLNGVALSIIFALAVCCGPAGHAENLMAERHSIPMGGVCFAANGDLMVGGNLQTSDQTEAGAAVHVKFAAGADVSDPMRLIPCRLQETILGIRRLTTLSDQELDQAGAEAFKRWFEITLKPGTSVQSFIKALKTLDHVEAVETAREPAPPPG
jgi:hypothetical protein